VCRRLLTHTVAAFCSHSSTWQISCWRRRLPKTHTSTCVVGSRCVKIIIIITRNVGQCPTWWPPCRIQVAPSVQRRKVWLMPTATMPCSKAAKTRNPLKFAGVPQTRQQPLVGWSSPYYEGTWRRYCCLTSFFLIVDTCLSYEDIVRQSCAMLPKWWFLRPVFPASHVQHISDMHSKFALGPHHVWKYGRHPISDRWDKARNKKR